MRFEREEGGGLKKKMVGILEENPTQD